MSEIEDIGGTEFDKLLQQVHLGELDVVDSRINEQQDISNSSSPIMGVVIVLIDLADQLFTYPKKFLVTFDHRGSDKQGANEKFTCAWTRTSQGDMHPLYSSSIAYPWVLLH